MHRLVWTMAQSWFDSPDNMWFDFNMIYVFSKVIYGVQIIEPPVSSSEMNFKDFASVKNFKDLFALIHLFFDLAIIHQIFFFCINFGKKSTRYYKFKIWEIPIFRARTATKGAIICFLIFLNVCIFFFLKGVCTALEGLLQFCSLSWD